MPINIGVFLYSDGAESDGVDEAVDIALAEDHQAAAVAAVGEGHLVGHFPALAAAASAVGVGHIRDGQAEEDPLGQHRQVGGAVDLVGQLSPLLHALQLFEELAAVDHAANGSDDEEPEEQNAADDEDGLPEQADDAEDEGAQRRDQGGEAEKDQGADGTEEDHRIEDAAAPAGLLVARAEILLHDPDRRAAVEAQDGESCHQHKGGGGGHGGTLSVAHPREFQRGDQGGRDDGGGGEDGQREAHRVGDLL